MLDDKPLLLVGAGDQTANSNYYGLEIILWPIEVNKLAQHGWVTHSAASVTSIQPFQVVVVPTHHPTGIIIIIIT